MHNLNGNPSTYDSLAKVGFYCLKMATRRFVGVKKFSPNFSSLFVIQTQLPNPGPSFVVYDLFISLWCFSMLVNTYFNFFP